MVPFVTVRSALGTNASSEYALPHVLGTVEETNTFPPESLDPAVEALFMSG